MSVMNISQEQEFRYRFAGQAMQGMLSNPTYMESVAKELRDNGGDGLAGVVAEDALQFADALIAEIKKTENR